MRKRRVTNYDFHVCPHEGACGGRWHGLCTTLKEIPESCTFQKPELPCIPNDICALRTKGLSYTQIGARLEMSPDEVLRIVAAIRSLGFQVSGRAKTRYATPEDLRTAKELLEQGKKYAEIEKVIGFSRGTIRTWKETGRI